jgi:sulfur carrier protein
MQIQLNGAAFELADAQTIASVLEQLQLSERRVAVELNLELVPRSLHASTQLQPGDVLEIVHAIGGG